MNKKILFLRASTGWKDPSPPMAFAYLGRIAKDNGWKVFIENLNAQYNKKTTKDIIDLIKKENIELVGVSIFTNYVQNSYDLIKSIRPYCKIIMAGGPHSTIYPEEILDQGADIVGVGESEGYFADLLEAIFKEKGLEKVRGIVYKDKGKIMKNPWPEQIDIDKLPIPEKDFFRKSDYIKVKEEINNLGGILTSRGCPGRCTYCYHSMFGRCFRYRSAENVFKEITYLHKKYGINHINFIDDAFTINRKRLIELCDKLIEAKLPIGWVCATRIDFLDKEVLTKMGESGCVMISLGVESFIPHALIKMKKTGNPKWYIKRTKDILKWCYDLKIRAGVNILTGFPWETKEDIKKMQWHIKKIRKYVTQGFCGGILQPMPNTEVYNQYAKQYNFENWWLKRELLFKEDYHPFFMNYYHVFFEQLQNDFFNMKKEVFKEIDKLYKMMGKWNLKIIVNRRFKNPVVRYALYNGLFIISNISLLLYVISPKLEKFLMKNISNFSYRFKYRH